MPAAPLRQTRQRVAVAETLAEASGFSTAQQVHERLAARGEPVALATVYRHLQALAEAGRADVLRTPDGQLAYRCCAHGERHHHHLVCRACGHTVEVEFGTFEAVVAELASRHGFAEVTHELELFGLCPRCAAGRAASMTDNGRRADLP
jgi:Fur family ferric uptake transcriptional regulator